MVKPPRDSAFASRTGREARIRVSTTAKSPGRGVRNRTWLFSTGSLIASSRSTIEPLRSPRQHAVQQGFQRLENETRGRLVPAHAGGRIGDVQMLLHPREVKPHGLHGASGVTGAERVHDRPVIRLILAASLL